MNFYNKITKKYWSAKEGTETYRIMTNSDDFEIVEEKPNFDNMYKKDLIEYIEKNNISGYEDGMKKAEILKLLK
ncbi:MAG: hypothetical protein ACOC2W_00795 [bacterium]